ncbi:unnamed protein product [Brassicogethes aeneus]|uniref:Doublesex dimerisation domain-containing protein n=1 Tax=Brassicogethes aeneus TaxID=1431903 RepID=A0A9P0AW15_BRAAE|nr:unnamed protein product [Brassicogethes aeneus]
MIPLVDVILKYAKENQDEAWRQIEEAFLYIKERTLAALEVVEAARYNYHPIPYLGLYPSAEAHYQPVYLPSMSLYHPVNTLLTTDLSTCTSPPSNSPPLANSTPISTGSRA